MSSSIQNQLGSKEATFSNLGSLVDHNGSEEQSNDTKQSRKQLQLF
jgi:hypothetical protein